MYIWALNQETAGAETTELYVLCHFGFGESFPHERLHVTHSSCTLWVSSFDTCFHLYTLALKRARVFPWEKPELAACTVQNRTVFLKIYLSCAPHSLPQFKCCGWNNYTDWSWNLYFNCTHENPSSERCAVPYSCCTPIPGEVRFSVQPHNIHCMDRLI